jgi:hypothetical protein
MSAVIRRFATSEERCEILQGLLEFRSDLQKIGIVDGYQWLDGSFVEDVETTRSRPPKDIDLVTLANRPIDDMNEFGQLVRDNLTLFRPQLTSQKYKVDAYFIDLKKPSRLLVEDTAYFFGLFSRQRVTSLWKGMLRVDLGSDDEEARRLLELAIANNEALKLLGKEGDDDAETA